MGWSAQYFTTIIIEGNTPQTGIFIYGGTPGPSTLIGSWAAAAGQDAFGNTYPAGINITQGQIIGVTIANSTATVMAIMNSVMTASTINSSQFNQGQILETTIIFDSGGGQLFGYTTSTTTTTHATNGDYNYTATATGTGTISCWGAGAGGDGGQTNSGGNGGSGGEFAQEPNYPLVNTQVYAMTVGAGGGSSSTGAGHGGDGGDTFFDQGGAGGGVFANGGNGNGTAANGSTNTVEHPSGTAPTSGGASGGASGSNSGAPTAAGNNGNAPSGATGGASPTAQTNAGRGGAGGNSGANGSNGTGPGGGGGGAGQGSGVTNKNKTYEATYTGSYYGPDATNGNPNGLRSTVTCWQGGETASGGAANGNQRCVFVFPTATMAADFAGYTMTQCQLKLTNEHSWYDSGMTVEIDEGGGNNYPASGPAPSTWQGNQNKLQTTSITEGETKTFSLGAGPAHDLVNQLTNFLGLGAFVAADNPYNLNYYGYFTGGHGTALEITLYGTIGSGSTTSGTGADGQVTITVATSTIMEFALSPQAGSDANSNAFAAGYTGPANVFDPNASPNIVEVWHSLTLLNGWAKQGFARYKLIGYNQMLVEFQINDSSATSGTFFNMPTGYAATQGQFFGLPVFNNVGGAPLQSVAIAQIATGVNGAVSILDWAKQSKQYVGNFIISLD